VLEFFSKNIPCCAQKICGVLQNPEEHRTHIEGA